jgi:hypothetical protein
MKNVEQRMLIYEGEQRNDPFGEWALQVMMGVGFVPWTNLFKHSLLAMLAQSHPFGAGSRFQNSMFDIQRFKITLNFKKANTRPLEPTNPWILA